MLIALMGNMFFLVAQPTLTIESQTPAIGETYAVQYAEVSDFDLGETGTDRAWDYSSNDWMTFELEFSILAPGDGLSNVDFPDADFVWYLAGFDAYNYYEVTDAGLELIGGASGEEDDILFKEIFSDSEDALQLPATYGDSYTYFSAFTSFIFGTQTSATRNGTVEFDSYGTLITPFGTYEDVLRMVITSSVSSFPNETETQYAWMQRGQFVPLMVYTFSSDPEETPTVYYAQRNEDTAVRQPDNIDLGLQLLGNPVQDQLIVTGASEVLNTARLSVCDPLGRMLSLPLNNSGFQVSSLAAGHYFLVVVTPDGRQVLPFVKI